jgi:DNA-binding NarL/FixJ family response regulator
MPIRVGIVDDHPGVRDGIRNLLAGEGGIEVVGEGANGAEAIELVRQEKLDVLLLDVELPVLRGDVVMQHLRELGIDVKVLALSSYNDPVYIQGMLENGAAGYITKEEAPRLLITAINSIMDDRVKWISPMVVGRLTKIELDDMNFSGRELEILRLVVMEKTKRQISEELDIEEAGVTQSLSLLMNKFGVASLDELRVAAGCILSTART